MKIRGNRWVPSFFVGKSKMKVYKIQKSILKNDNISQEIPYMMQKWRKY